MGVDVYMHVYVGALVEENEIFITSKETSKKCSKCPEAIEAGHKFCSECGHKFREVSSTKWTPGALALLNQEEEAFEADETDDLEYTPFFDANRIQGSGFSAPMKWAVGFEVLNVSWEGRARTKKPITESAFAEMAAKVKAMIETMGLPPREVEVFPYLYVSC